MFNRDTLVPTETEVQGAEVVVADGCVDVELVSAAREGSVVGHLVVGRGVVAVMTRIVDACRGGGRGGGGRGGGVGKSGEVV